jgi:hypothetical protein
MRQHAGLASQAAQSPSQTEYVLIVIKGGPGQGLGHPAAPLSQPGAEWRRAAPSAGSASPAVHPASVPESRPPAGVPGPGKMEAGRSGLAGQSIRALSESIHALSESIDILSESAGGAKDSPSGLS